LACFSVPSPSGVVASNRLLQPNFGLMIYYSTISLFQIYSFSRTLQQDMRSRQHRNRDGLTTSQKALALICGDARMP
jgi:hypothetical protein